MSNPPAWIILRCSGGSTLRLAHSLETHGYDVWTPIEIQVKRDRRTGARSERIVSVMPTYVFAKADRLADLMQETMAVVSQHPTFSVFRHMDRFPLVADRELAELRQIEKMAVARSQPVVFTKAADVKVVDGPFHALTGQVVETSKGQHTLVAFPGFHIPVKFATWQLSPVQVETKAPEQGVAAKAA